MLKSNVFRLACCVFIAAVALGQSTKRLKLKDGRSLVGVVTEVDVGYEVETRSGGVVRIPRDQVVSVVEIVTPEGEYRKRLEKIDPNSPEDHFKLGEWAYEQRLLKVAQKELKAALKLKKDYEIASLLLREVEAKILADEARRKPPVGRVTGEPGLPGRMRFDPDWLVSEEEIYRIRLEEIRATDRVVVSFRRRLIDRFIDMMQGRGDFERPRFGAEFRTYPPVRQAMYILEHVRRDDVSIKDDILIKTDPRFMIDFRRRVWPVITTYCAAADCHGREKPVGKLRLFRMSGRNVRADYTNFLILQSYVTGGRKLIDRDHKDLSLLLHYGLPPEQTRFSHPIRIKSAYTTRDSRNYREVLSWIESLAGPPCPDYRVKLRIPWAPKVSRVTLPDAPPPATSPVTTKPSI